MYAVIEKNDNYEVNEIVDSLDEAIREVQDLKALGYKCAIYKIERKIFVRRLGMPYIMRRYGKKIKP